MTSQNCDMLVVSSSGQICIRKRIACAQKVTMTHHLMFGLEFFISMGGSVGLACKYVMLEQ